MPMPLARLTWPLSLFWRAFGAHGPRRRHRVRVSMLVMWRRMCIPMPARGLIAHALWCFGHNRPDLAMTGNRVICQSDSGRASEALNASDVRRSWGQWIAARAAILISDGPRARHPLLEHLDRNRTACRERPSPPSGSRRGASRTAPWSAARNAPACRRPAGSGRQTPA